MKQDMIFKIKKKRCATVTFNNLNVQTNNILKPRLQTIYNVKWICRLVLLFFEEFSVIAKCGQLSRVQLQSFINFWCFCMYIICS